MKEQELTKFNWQRAMEDNIGLITNNLMQIEMATEVIKLCEKKIAEFPEDPPVEEPKTPAGVN